MNKRNIRELSHQEKLDLMKSEFEKKSFFESLFPNCTTVKIACEEFYQKFYEQLKRLLIEKNIVTKIDYPLEELHLHLPQEMKDYNFNDGVNKISAFFYENDKEFTQTYFDFVKNFLRKQFNFPFYFQTIPTIRIHCPEAKNSNHYPRYHTDIGYGHPVQEINLWMNLTKPIGEQKHGFKIMDLKNSLKLYQKYNYDFKTIVNKAINNKEFNEECSNLSIQSDTNAGEILAMDSRCYHTGEPMLHHTRISIDIRIIPVKEYNSLPVIYQGDGRMKTLFQPGECYYSLDSNQL